MSVRSLSQNSFFDPEFVDPGCLEPGTVPWLLGRYRSMLFPAWIFKGWRGSSSWGRCAWPAAILMTLLVLRWTEEGMSRRASARQAKRHTSWRAAMGLALGAPSPDEKTIREFERFMQGRHPECDGPRYLLLHGHWVRMCLDAGVVDDTRKAFTMDSTPMWCFGATLDTIRLLGDGLRSLGQKWALASKASLEEVARQWDLPLLLAKSTKGALATRDPEQRAQAVHELAQTALRVVDLVRGSLGEVRRNKRKGVLRACRRLVKVVVDDLETDEQGRLVVAQRVAKDRLVSFTDPQARHGRKSRSKTFKGYKISLLGELVSGLILSLTVTSGNQHDARPAHRLIRRAKQLYDNLKRVLADTAYGGAELRYRVEALDGVHLVAPPPPVSATPDGKLGRDRIVIDFKTMSATCAAKVTTTDHELKWSAAHGRHTTRFSWPGEICQSCPLREACCGRKRSGNVVELHPNERELRQAREEWEDPKVRQEYRLRTQCERLVNQVVRHGGRKARAWGLRSANFQAHIIAMRCNLGLLAKALAKKEDVTRQLAA